MTIDVVFRNEKGDELTWEEMDGNLANLQVAIETKKDNFSILPVSQGGTGVATIAEAKQVLEVPEFANQIEYMPDGTGAVATDVQSKLREFLSLADGASTLTLHVPSQYATIQAAMAYLNTKVIGAGAVVTIQVADGTHDYTGASVSLNHPQGSQIRLLGNVTTPTNCVLTWTNTTTGIDGLTVTDGHTLGYIDGFHITRTAHAGLKISTGLLADNSSTIICGAHMKVSNHYYGIAARMGSYIKGDSAIVDGAGDVGIWSFVGSTIDCSSAVVTNTADPLQSLGFGIQAEYGSSVNCDLANSSGNKIGGIAALSGSNVRANSATASSNTGSGLFARDGGTIEAHSATATGNTRYGIEELTGGAVYGNSMTYAGTLGARAPVAMLNYDTALGARLSSRSGALRIDTEDTNPIYFHTSGGLQLEVGHASSAVNRARIKGAATGVSISFEAVSSTDTNVSVNVRGQGTGSVFIGNSQANYARFNGAAAGSTPAIYAEGSDSNVSLLVSGKGAGVPLFPSSSTTRASFRVPHGSAPTSPVDGDIWTTTAGLYVRINGATVGPLS